MPVRKIPKSFRAVTGRFPSVVNGRCIGYESKLEYDYFLRLEFDPTVKSYEEQPVQIPGVVNGREVTYVLDCLVFFNTDRCPLLVEVKSEEELEEKAETLEKKFSHAHAYAQKNNFDFTVVTERQIYDTALENYKLLYRFARPPVQLAEKRQQIIELLRSYDQIALGQLLYLISDQKQIQAAYQPIVWHMIFSREIETDLTVKMEYSSELRLSHGG
ncbi:TnsA endonuclease N terminal [Malonomonas rubra DSM 5091]|uniref:TnsA endonuclease N terminal n=1 Tax=Malonomonas rubra DSM 5091 TaxID=1122189 RepID=A0A1M6H814_MALRU|nr:TnsA endonuclease N-terminal domain-containing protein [Malonomonas rubra]SHJ18269.1 TnsA endonuclease N terminal [Malonomonas rubra DSM 5091]